MVMDDAAPSPYPAAERELLAEFADTARCPGAGVIRPVSDCPPCAARLITHLHAEIVSLRVLAQEARTAANAQPDSRPDGGAREHAQRLLGEYFRAAFLGAGLTWRDTHDAGLNVLVDCLIEAVRQDIVTLMGRPGQAAGATVESAPQPTRRTELIAARKAAGLTQEELAARLGVERSTVYRWESGETNPLPMLRPGLAKLLRMADERLSALLGEPVNHVALTTPEPGQPATTCS
jgi:DNA-binding XRE family transcriptional regulator